MEKQGKVLAIINDPCHNPTGYSLTNEEWKKLIAAINQLSKKGPFVLLDDIAYIDYSYNLDTCRNYMANFNDIGEDVMIIVAFSSSKTLTSYGLRCGAAVVLAKREEAVNEFISLSEKSARALCQTYQMPQWKILFWLQGKSMRNLWPKNKNMWNF